MSATNEFVQKVIAALQEAKLPPSKTSDEAFRATLTIVTSTLLCEKLCGCEQSEKTALVPYSTTVKPGGHRPTPDELLLMATLALRMTEVKEKSLDTLPMQTS